MNIKENAMKDDFLTAERIERIGQAIDLAVIDLKCNGKETVSLFEILTISREF
jgi:hypothetical protein